MLVETKLKDFVIYFLLFLFGIGFLGKQTYIVLLTGLLVFLFNRKKRIERSSVFSFLMLISFSVFCVIFGFTVSPTTGFKSLCCLAMFYVGNNLNFKETGSLKKSVLFLAFSFALYPVLNFIYELFQFGFSLSFLNNTVHYDLWSKEDSAVTLIASNACLIASLFGYFLFCCKNKVIIIAGMCIISIVVFYDLILGGRTFLLILLIMFALEILFVLFVHKTKGFKKMIKRFLIFSLISCVMLLLLISLFGNIRSAFIDFFENTHFFSRFGETSSSELLQTSRWTIRNQYLSLFWTHPFGGRLIFEKVGMLPHELWLDVYDVAGIFSFAPFILYFVASFFHIATFCLKSSIDVETKNIVVFCCVGLLLQFMVEPIFSGNPALLFVYCFIDGAIINYSSKNRLKQAHYSHACIDGVCRVAG